MKQNEFIGATFFKYFIGAAGAALFSFFTVPFLTRVLNPAEYGKGMMFVTVISLLFMLCNCGMDQSYVRFYYETDSDKSRLQLLYTCLGIIGIVFLSVFLILAFTYQWFLSFFFEQKTFTLFLTILIGTFAFILNRFRLLTLRMQKRAIAYSLGQILTQAFYVVAIIVLYFGYDLKHFTLIVYAQIFSLLLAFLVFFVFDFKSWNFFNLRSSGKSEFTPNEIFKYGGPFLFVFVLTWLFQSIDRVALLKWSNYYELGIYSAAFSLIVPLTMMQSIFTTLWAPIANEAIIKNHIEAKKMFSNAFNMMLFVMAVGAMLVMLFNPLIIMLLGQKYRAASKIFVWLLFSPFFYLLSELVIGGIILTKKSHLNIFVSIASVAVNITACYLLIPRIGATGAAIALAISYFVFFCTRLLVAFQYYSFQICWWRLILVICLLVFAAGTLWHALVFRLIILLMILLLFCREISALKLVLVTKLNLLINKTHGSK